MTRSKSQTLITGVYRTGSEYLANLINCHPKVSVTMYSVNLLRFIHGRYNPISKEENIKSALNDLGARLLKRYGRKLDKESVLEALTRHRTVDYGILYDAVMSVLYLQPPAEHWAEKNQLLWREIPTFLDMMPNGKAILIIRDPRSVLLSFKRYTYAPPPGYLGAVFNSLDAMQFALKYRERLPSDRFRCFRYEDVARDPKGLAGEVWQFMNLEGVYDVRDQSSWKDAYGRSWHVNSSFHDERDLRPFDVEASINRWQAGLCAEEIGLTEAICGETMTRFGYTPAGCDFDWISATRLLLQDDTIGGYFRKWLSCGTGVEAFPTDPLNEENWRDAQERKYESE